MNRIDRASSAEAGRSGLWLTVAMVLVSGLVLSLPAAAWSGWEHHRIAWLAAASAPADLPDFFRGGSDQIADASVEPDTTRVRALPQLRAGESPEHYLDLEYLDGEPLPPSRYEFVALLHRKNLQPERIGLVPYAIAEATQRLTVAFAEYRLRPENEGIRGRILYLAGVLSHYAADMAQPLHTTLHHNGRARADGSSPGTGIHHLVDSLPSRTGATFRPVAGTPWPEPFPDLMAGIVAVLKESHELVDRTYELEDLLEWQDGNEPHQEIVAFAGERLMASVLFTSRLYATAWDLSAGLELPPWRLAQLQKQSE